jgi:cytochrome c553
VAAPLSPLPRLRPRCRGRAAALAAALLLAGCALGAAPAQQAAPVGPRISLDHRDHDFGQVLQGKIVEHRFPFTNTGDADLVIEDVSTPCGCTAVVPDQTRIAPGRSSSIDVTYDSAARSGDVERVVTVRSNDSVEPVLELHLTAHVDASQHEGFMAGETLFGEKCGRCHAEPARDDAGREVTGLALYDGVCWFCHGAVRQGKTAPALGRYPEASDPYLTRIISEGVAGTEMPAFAQASGGPLSAAQIASLVALLHTVPPPPPPEPESEPEPPAGDTDGPFFK